MPDHSPSFIPTEFPTPAPASPVVSPPPPRPTEFDYLKILDLTPRKASRGGATRTMKVGEERVKNYEKNSQRVGKSD